MPVFEASRADTATKLATTTAAGAAAANRFLYYEFCHQGYVDGLLPQSYANGWGQAVRFDDNATEHRTEWKAIAVNSDYTNVLLYNITDDQVSKTLSFCCAPTRIVLSKTVPFLAVRLPSPSRSRSPVSEAAVAALPFSLPFLVCFSAFPCGSTVILTEDRPLPTGKPVGPDRTGDLALGQRLAGRDPAAVAKALAFAIGLFHSEHVENPYWKSSKNVTDRWVRPLRPPRPTIWPWLWDWLCRRS